MDRLQELIDEYLNGDASPAQIRELETLLKADPERRRLFVQRVMLDVNLIDMYAGASTSLPLGKDFKAAPRKTRRPQLRTWGRNTWLAAAAMLAVSIGIGFYMLRTPSAVQEFVAGKVTVDGVESTRVPDGAKVSVIGKDAAVFNLSDGSRTELAPDSTAIFHGKSGPARQVVEVLDGGAKFEVKKGERQFKVETPVAFITVVGTAFTVEVQPGSQAENGGEAMQRNIVAMILMVTAGTVEVSYQGNTFSISAGQRRVFGEEGAPVPPESKVKAAAVTGCKVDFYDFPHWVPKGIDSLDDAKAFVAGNKPTLSIDTNSRSISFPPDKDSTVNGDRCTLGAYLFGEAAFAAKVKAAEAKGTPLPARLKEAITQRSVFIYSGFVNVAKAGTYLIKMPVDDGDELIIGGVVVHSKTTFGGMTNPTDPAYASKVTFFEPGIYPIKVLHWDREQELGIHLYCDLDPKGEVLVDRILLPLMRKSSGPDE